MIPGRTARSAAPPPEEKVTAAAFSPEKGGGWYETDFKTGNKRTSQAVPIRRVQRFKSAGGGRPAALPPTRLPTRRPASPNAPG